MCLLVWCKNIFKFHFSRNRFTNITTGSDLFSEITNDDYELISALDWIIFYPRQVEEAFVQINAVVRNFVAQGKIQAARLAFNKVCLSVVFKSKTYFMSIKTK